MFGISQNYIKKSIDSDSLLPLNRAINRRIKVISVSREIFSKIASWGSKSAIVGFVSCIVFPTIISPVLTIAGTSILSMGIFKILNKLELRAIITKSKIYHFTIIPNLEKTHLGDRNFPQLIYDQKTKRLDGRCKRFPHKTIPLVVDYAKQYTVFKDEAQGHLENLKGIEIEDIIDFKQIDFEDEEVLAALRSNIQAFVAKQGEMIKEEFQDAVLNLHSNFYKSFINEYAYKKYIEQRTSDKSKNLCMTPGEYSEKIKYLIRFIKRVKMIVSLEELVRKPVEVEKELNWMAKNLKYKHYVKYEQIRTNSLSFSY